MKPAWKYLTVPAVVVTVALGVVLPASGSDIASFDTAGKHCGRINIAVNNWVGYVANAYVIGELAKNRLGCQVNYVSVAEQTSWQGFASGEIDAIVENWGHPDLKKIYIDQMHVAQKAGKTGNAGVIGWYVPPWMVKKYPKILDWKVLNKHADLFKTSESGGKGQFLDGSPAFVTHDAAIIKNLNMDFKVVYAGSETALIQAFRKAQKNKTPLVGYFYSPQWFLSEVPLKKVKLPKYTDKCPQDPEKWACDYPAFPLDKVVSTKFAHSGSPGYTLIRRFHWADLDQDTVARYIAEDGMSAKDAADKWIAAHPKKVNSWLPASAR